MADRTDSYTLVRAGGLIDGQGGPPIPNGAVLLRGSVIEAVGRQGNLAGPEGAYTQARIHRRTPMDGVRKAEGGG